MLADVLGLVGSSPTPGASDVGSTTKRNKNKQREFVLKTKSNRYMILQKSQIEENNNNNNLYSSSSSNTEEELERKIDSITTGLSRPYFNKILKELVKKNLENATTTNKERGLQMEVNLVFLTDITELIFCYYYSIRIFNCLDV